MPTNPASARRDLFGWEDLRSTKPVEVAGPLFERVNAFVAEYPDGKTDAEVDAEFHELLNGLLGGACGGTEDDCHG
jgi:hypothetical protein